ncbi:MAG: response regulator [Bermanella sp.]
MADSDYSHKKFLIIDDFESFQKILKRLLLGLNAQDIATASNGLQAVKSCQNNKYDVIFCDFDLGKGLNGLQVLEELRYHDLLKSSAVFIMITAESGRDAVVGAMEYKPDAYMSKPVSAGELSSRLVKSLKQKQALSAIHLALDEGDYQKAIAKCDEHIDAAKSRHKNWCLKTKGELLIKLARLQPARALYEQVLAERPIFWAQLGLAHALAGLKMDEAALQAYQLAYSENPTSLEAFEGAANMLVKLGDPIAAQKLLEKSSKISSRSVTRQKLLVDICKINGDFEGAAKAGRKVVKLAEYGQHKSADNDLDLADNLTEAALNTRNEERAKELAKEALDTLQKTEKKYQGEAVKIQSKLVESRAHASLDHDQLAQEALQSAEQKMADAGIKPDLRTQLELAKSYFQTGHKDKANELLKELAIEHQADPDISARLDKLVDEPVTKAGKQAVVKINKDGIAMFEQGEFQMAIKNFMQAIQKFPKHLGIRLNIVQSFLYDMKKNGPNREKIKLCEQHMAAIKNMSEDNQQYKRYLSFKSALDALSQHLLKGKQ